MEGSLKMMKHYFDSDNEIITNYLGNMEGNCFGFDKIMKLFREVKESVYYDSFAPMQRASETLVMGRGNNLDKTILLQSLLTASGFDSRMYICYVKDRTARIISRGDNVIKWYYVEINLLGRKIKLDCSFDKGFMRAAGIVNRDTAGNYGIDKYFKDNIPLFKIIGSPKEIKMDDEGIDFSVLKAIPV